MSATLRWAFLNLLLHCMSVCALNEPKIVKSPEDVVIVTGEDVTLPCVVDNLPLGDNFVQWTKDGFAFGYDRDMPAYKYSVVGDVSLGEYNLRIEEATIEDEAQYECQVQVGDIRMREKAMVKILVPPKGPFIEHAAKDGSLNVMANTENLITCKSTNGKPAGALAWYKDGAELSKNVTFDEVSTSAGKLLNSSATLKLWPTSNDDGNSYQCGMKIDGRFLGTNGVEDLNPAATVEINVQKPPIAIVSMQYTEVKEGDDAHARCESFASKPPATSYRWFINGVLQNDRTRDSLRISLVDRTMDGDVIACAAVNSVGESERSMSTLTVLYPPTLKSAPKPVTTEFPAVANMSCAWESNPPARITWYKRGELNAVLSEGEYLEIDVRDQSAAGVYVCFGDAYGAGSNSASARLDVLGPPIIDSDSVQRNFAGQRAVINCSIMSKPGISHATWSWRRGGTVMTLENNGTAAVGGRTKYAGAVGYGDFTASLIVEDATRDDFTEYNCTVSNSYGHAAATIKLEEQAAARTAMTTPVMVAIIAGAALLIAILLLIAVCCVRKKRQEKSTTFPPVQDATQVDGGQPTKENTREDAILTAKLLNADEDGQPSSAASVASHDIEGNRVGDVHRQAHNDDGYHTEEANSWKRNGNQSPPSSPARSGDEEYSPNESREPSVHMMAPLRDLEFERTTSPYAPSDAPSDNGYLRYNMQPQPYPPLQYAPNVVDLPPVARTASPLNMYGAPVSPPLPPNMYPLQSTRPAYGSVAQGYPPVSQLSRAGSAAPSVVSSHRSVTPSPYILGRATPNSLLMDRGMYHVPVSAQRASSSQSSLDQAAPSNSRPDFYENHQIHRLNSMASHASRSSEMLSKPMTARMATHV